MRQSALEIGMSRDFAPEHEYDCAEEIVSADGFFPIDFASEKLSV